MTTTVELFNLFYETGLLEHNTYATTKDLMTAMVHIDGLRAGFATVEPDYFECIKYDTHGRPVAHIAGMPCFGRSIWRMGMHCSKEKGAGIAVLEDVWTKVCRRDHIKFVMGLHSPDNPRAVEIWNLACELIGNTDVCDQHTYNLCEDYTLYPSTDRPVPNLFIAAFLSNEHQMQLSTPLFSRPTAKNPIKKKLTATLFRVCNESKDKFRQLFAC